MTIENWQLLLWAVSVGLSVLAFLYARRNNQLSRATELSQDITTLKNGLTDLKDHVGKLEDDAQVHARQCQAADSRMARLETRIDALPTTTQMHDLRVLLAALDQKFTGLHEDVVEIKQALLRHDTVLADAARRDS